jgi:hypothetical protein
MANRFNADQIDSSLNTFREVFSDPTKSGDPEGFNGNVIIPLDFTLEMDGISGLIPHSAFTIPVETLPDSYIVQSGDDKGKSKIAFILHSIDQNFSNNKWTTKIAGQTLNIRFEPLTEAEKKAIKDAQDKQKSAGNLGGNFPPGNPPSKPSKNRQAAYDKLEETYPGFKEKLKLVAKNIGATEDILTRVMWAESYLRTDIDNGIGCVGLIQFCPNSDSKSQKTIGKKTYNLKSIQKMTGLDQLDVVQAYFQSLGFSANKPVTMGDLYGATFYPVSRNKSQDWIVGSENKNPNWKFEVYNDNPAIAKFSNRKVGGKGVIDKAAFTRYVASK